MIVGGGFNARISGKFSYYSVANRKGELLETFFQQHNLLASNTLFQKPNRKLWTWRHPAGHLAQTDCILFSKRWRNGFNDCQAHTSSVNIVGDHNILKAKIRLSLRAPKSSTRKLPYWQTPWHEKDLATTIDDLIFSKFDALPIDQQTYASFVSICNEVEKKKLPSHQKRTSPTIEHHDMDLPRSNTKKAPIQRVQLHQNTQRQTKDRLEDARLNKTLLELEKKSRGNPKNAWNSKKRKNLSPLSRLKIVSKSGKTTSKIYFLLTKMIIKLNLTASSCLTSTQKLVLPSSPKGDYRFIQSNKT